MRGGPYANRVVFSGKLKEIGPLRVLVDHGKKNITAKIPIRGGYKIRNRWKSAHPIVVHVTAWNDEAEKLAEMKPKDYVQLEGYFSTQDWWDANGKLWTFLHLTAASVTKIQNPTDPDTNPQDTGDVPIGDLD